MNQSVGENPDIADREAWKSKMLDRMANLAKDLFDKSRSFEDHELLFCFIGWANQWRSKDAFVAVLENAVRLLKEDEHVDESQLQMKSDDVVLDQSREDAMKDRRLVLQKWGAGDFVTCEHDYIAFFNGEVLGSGNAPSELRRYWAQEKQVPIQRIVIKYVQD